MIPATFVNYKEWAVPDNIPLADETFNQRGQIDLLLRAEVFLSILRSGRQTGPDDYPVLQETALEWTLARRTQSALTRHSVQHSFFIKTGPTMEQQLQRFWEIESMDHPTRSQEERTREKHFLDNTIRHMSGRFIVRLPVKKSFTVLGTSHKVAETRFLILENDCQGSHLSTAVSRLHKRISCYGPHATSSEVCQQAQHVLLFSASSCLQSL